MYYACMNAHCEALFDEPEHVNQPFDDGVGWRDEWWDCCPVCGCTEFVEAEKCEECGDWCAPWVIKDGLCNYCYSEYTSWKEINI